MTKIGDWMQTADGKAVHPLDVEPDDFDIRVVAFALAGKNRFGGHAGYLLDHDLPRYNVAHHTVLASYAIVHAPTYQPGDELEALVHEPDEVFLPDVPRPIKYDPRMTWYRDLCASHERAFRVFLELPPEPPTSVSWVDDVMLATEARDLMAPPPRPWHPLPPPLPERIVPWTAGMAERRWLERFHELTNVELIEGRLNTRTLNRKKI